MAANSVPSDFHVIIVGAGPAGLLLALLLSSCQPPIRSTVLERRTVVDDNPRASFYASPVLKEFRRVPGLMERVLADAFIPDAVAWRHLDGREICRVAPQNDLEREKRGEEGVTMISLPLDGLLPIMAELLKEIAGDGESGVARVLYDRNVVGVGEDKERGKAWVDVKIGQDGPVERMEGTYVVGCDGANSTIRKALFGDSWPGFTWDKQIVATNVYYPRFKSFNWTSSSFMLDPTHWSMIAQIATDGLLRITYGEEGNLTREQMQERLPWKYKQFVPGAPEPSEYTVVNFSPYRIHQRCADSLRVGRVLLAADSAHVCNPFGGMGLTGGLVDVGNLFDCLYGIATGRADESILDKYSEIRIKKYREIIDPISSGNIRRLWESSDEYIANEPFFQMVERAKTDEALRKEMENGLDAIMHDFTQYYRENAVA